MRPILLSVGSLNFYAYGFFTALGFIVAGLVCDYLARRKRLLTKKHREYFLIDGLLLGLVSGLAAARLAYIVLYNLILRTQTFDLTSILGGGFIFYAGLAVGLGLFYRWLKRHEENAGAWLDILMISILVGLAVSEIGGYLNDGLIVHVAGFFGNLTLAAIGYAIFMTNKRAGQTFWSSLFLLFLLNLFMGFWRTEIVSWFGLTLLQWASFVGMASVSFVQLRHNRVS